MSIGYDTDTDTFYHCLYYIRLIDFLFIIVCLSILFCTVKNPIDIDISHTVHIAL